MKLTFLEHIMTLVLISFFTGALCGFVGGVLVVRNNKAKAEALDQKATAALDSFKK